MGLFFVGCWCYGIFVAGLTEDLREDKTLTALETVGSILMVLLVLHVYIMCLGDNRQHMQLCTSGCCG